MLLLHLKLNGCKPLVSETTSGAGAVDPFLFGAGLHLLKGARGPSQSELIDLSSGIIDDHENGKKRISKYY